MRVIDVRTFTTEPWEILLGEQAGGDEFASIVIVMLQVVCVLVLMMFAWTYWQWMNFVGRPVYSEKLKVLDRRLSFFSLTGGGSILLEWNPPTWHACTEEAYGLVRRGDMLKVLFQIGRFHKKRRILGQQVIVQSL